MPKRSRKSNVPVIDSVTPEQLMAFQQGGGTVVGGFPGGEEFYSFTPNQNQNIKPKIDGKKLLYTMSNEFVARGMERQKNLLFTEKPKYHVYNADNNEDEDLADNVEKDFEKSSLVPGLFAAMKLSYMDIYGWGIYLLQIEWMRDVDGTIRPGKLKRLPPESFLLPPANTENYTCDDILQGIGVRNGIIEFWQTQNDGTMKRLSFVIMMKDPSLPGICGRSRLLSLVPSVSFLDLCVKVQAQKMNRVGAPALFIQFTSPPIMAGGRDDISHATKIIRYWGTSSQYILRENMQVVKLDFNDNQSALDTLKELKGDIDDHFNPTVFLSREGNSLGNDSGKIDTMKLFIQDAHLMIEDNWEPVIQTYLDLNAYENTIELELPAAEPDRAAINLQRAQAIDTMGIGTLDEKRVLSGLAEATPEVLAEIEKERETRAKMIPGATLGQGQNPVTDGQLGGRPPNPATKRKNPPEE